MFTPIAGSLHSFPLHAPNRRYHLSKEYKTQQRSSLQQCWFTTASRTQITLFPQCNDSTGTEIQDTLGTYESSDKNKCGHSNPRGATDTLQNSAINLITLLPHCNGSTGNGLQNTFKSNHIVPALVAYKTLPAHTKIASTTKSNIRAG